MTHFCFATTICAFLFARLELPAQPSNRVLSTTTPALAFIPVLVFLMGLPELASGQARRSRSRVTSPVRIQEDGTVQYRRDGKITDIGRVVTLPPGATYFHWTAPEAAQTILSNGLKDLSLLTGGSADNAMGSGFYVAENILDYGGTGRLQLITLEVRQPTRVVLVTGSWDPGLDRGDPHFRIKSKEVWDRAQKALREQGLSGVMFKSAFSGSYWYNFFAPAGENYLVRPTRQTDVINANTLKDPYNAYRTLFQYNQIQPLVADDTLYNFSPTLWRLASGQSLTPREREEFWSKAGSQLTTSRAHPRNPWTLSPRFIGGDSVLCQAFRREFRQELDELSGPKRIDLRRHGNADPKELEDMFRDNAELLKGWGYDVESNRPAPRLEVQAMAQTLPEELRGLHFLLNDRTNSFDDRVQALSKLVEIARTDSRALAPLILSYYLERNEDPGIINSIQSALRYELYEQLKAVESLPIKDPQHLRNLIARMPKNLLRLVGEPTPWNSKWGTRYLMRIESRDLIPLLVLSKAEVLTDEVVTAMKFFDDQYVHSSSEGAEMKEALLKRIEKFKADRNRRFAQICQGSLLPAIGRPIPMSNRPASK